MNIDETLLRYAGQPLETLPGDVRDLLDRDPGLRAQFQRQRDIAALMSLKRHERPDPALEGRLIHRVGTRIRNAPLRPRSVSQALNNLPAWARMATVVAVMVTLSVLTHKEMLRSEAGDLAATTAGDLAAGGRSLLDPDLPIPAASLQHLDPFTTLLPGRFAFETDELAAGRVLTPLPAIQTNQLWQAPPITLPVVFPSP